MKRLPNFLLMMLTAVLLATFIISCSESGSDSDPSTTPTQPQTPVAEGDWQVVPATGGTIEKGDITIIFPNGTFNKDTKIAITEVKKGQTVGSDYEASTFYQITMPITTHKPTTISIKSAKQDEDVQFIFQSRCYGRSTGQSTQSGIFIETNYTNGIYSTQLTSFENEDETQNESFIIGLAHAKQETVGTRETTRSSDRFVAEGQVKGIKWKLYINSSADGGYYSATNSMAIAKMAKYIDTAITEIRNQGYEIKDKDRVIPYYYVKMKDKIGAFQQSCRGDKYSWIGLNAQQIDSKPDDTLNIKSTVLHETFHYFQADYDPRCAFDKAGGAFGNAVDNENILYEMGAVWIEQFLRGGNLDENFLMGDPFKFENIFEKGDLLGLGLEEQRWGRLGLNKHDANMQQGYTMAPILYYFTTELKSFGFNKEAVLKLHQLWNKKWKSRIYNSYFILDEWVKSYDSYFFFSYGIDDYYLKLWRGELVKNMNIAEILRSNTLYIKNDGEKGYQFVDNCYPYGCGVRKVTLRGFKNISLSKSKLIIKQHAKGVHTYVLLTDYNSKWEKFKTVVRKGEAIAVEVGDSIVLDGNTLESLRLTEGYMAGEFNHQFFLVTTNIDNSIENENINVYNVSIELRDLEQKASVNPTELNYPAEGNTQSVKVTTQGYSNYGYNISDEYKSWISAKNVKGGTIEITAQPNTTGKERIGYVRVYVCNEEKPTEAQKVYLKDSIKVTQAANKEEEQQQESEYELVSGSVNMYYAVLWRWTKDFKAGDDGVTITPNGKGAKVVINQEGTDLTFTWHSTISFEIDDLSLNESNQARISHFRFELEKDVIPYQYYDFHIDSGHELTRMVSPAPKPSFIGGLWTYSKDDLSYYSKSTIHYDKWRKDYYSAYVEHTEESETSEVTDGSSISISLYIKKK